MASIERQVYCKAPDQVLEKMLKQQFDGKTPVIILGAGIVGICTALSLLERGFAVTIIDKGAPGQATSYGNAGVVSPWSIVPQSMPGLWKNIPKLMFGYGRPLSVHPKYLFKILPWGVRFLRLGQDHHVRAAATAMARLCAPSIDLYEKHLRGTGHERLLTDSIYVQAFRDGSKVNLSSLDYQIRQEKGADMEVVGQDRLAEIEPALGPDFKAAVLIKGAGRVRSPGQVASVLADKARRMGAKFIKLRLKKFTAMKPIIQPIGQSIVRAKIITRIGLSCALVLGAVIYFQA